MKPVAVVIMVQVSSLSFSEVDSSFHRLSSLLTVHTARYNVLVSPLRAAILEVQCRDQNIGTRNDAIFGAVNYPTRVCTYIWV